MMQESRIAELSHKILEGQIGVMPTDTIFGIVAKASNPEAIERVYDAKNRPAGKAFIILVSNFGQLESLGIDLTPDQKEALLSVWPGPASVILPCYSSAYEYLHRGLNSLAIRMPRAVWLKQMIDKTGPIIATSANVSGKRLHFNLDEIKAQVGGLDFYVDGDTAEAPSTLYRMDPSGELTEVER